MKSSKLIQVLSVLKEKEFKEFEKYALNYFHKNEKMSAFVEFLAYYFPNFEEEDISKENTYRFVFKNDNFEDIRIRELMSALNKVLKDYLVLTEVKSSDFYYELDLLKQYQRRKLTRLYNTQLKTVKNILNKDNFKNNEYFRRTYLLANIENDYFANRQVSEADNNIQIKLDNLDFYYFSTKLKESCDMLNRHKVLNHQYSYNLLEEVRLLIDKYKDTYLDKAPIKCYYEIYLLLQNEGNHLQLEKTLKVLKEKTPFFTKNEINALFVFPRNYCIRQINAGSTLYVETLFDIQKFLIENELNYIDNYLSATSYRNIVTIALKLKEFEWSEKFIENYKEKITPEFRENSYTISKANLFFSKGEHNETLSLLNLVEFTDIYYVVSAKVLMLKTYYALKEFETLSYFITAFKLYLKRNKEIPTDYKKGADLFLSNFKKIFNIAEKFEFIDSKKAKEKLNKIALDIKKEPNIHNRDWLLEIIVELNK